MTQEKGADSSDGMARPGFNDSEERGRGIGPFREDQQGFWKTNNAPKFSTF